MRRLLAVLLILTCSSTAVAGVDAVPLVHNGWTGVWLRDDDALRVLHAAESLPKARAVIASQDKLIAALEQQVHTATTAWQTADDALRDNEAYTHALEADLEASHSILRDPFLWLAIGVLAGAAVAAGTTALILKWMP